MLKNITIVLLLLTNVATAYLAYEFHGAIVAFHHALVEASKQVESCQSK